MMRPRLVISAPASGCGTTTVATGLMAALRARGVVVSGQRAGPGDVGVAGQGLASGRSGWGAGGFLCGGELAGPVYAGRRGRPGERGIGW